MKRREDSAVRAEVGMSHVGAFDRAIQTEREHPEVVGRHFDELFRLAPAAFSSARAPPRMPDIA